MATEIDGETDFEDEDKSFGLWLRARWALAAGGGMRQREGQPTLPYPHSPPFRGGGAQVADEQDKQKGESKVRRGGRDRGQEGGSESRWRVLGGGVRG